MEKVPRAFLNRCSEESAQQVSSFSLSLELLEVAEIITVSSTSSESIGLRRSVEFAPAAVARAKVAQGQRVLIN